MAEKKEPSTGETIGGCLLLIVLVMMLGQCVFGGEDEPANDPEIETPDARPSTENILNRALIDSIAETDGDAASYVAAHINTRGHLCAQIMEVQPTGGAQYRVGCILSLNGSGRANYLVDARTGSVDPI